MSNHEVDLRRLQLEESLREELASSVPERVDRWLAVQRVPIVPFTHFSLPSSECTLLFRDGYYFACIALCQAVAESLVRSLCHSNGLRPTKSFDTNLGRLRKAKVLSTTSAEALTRVWSGRNDYLHINPAVARSPTELRPIALAKLGDLASAEHDAFQASYAGGRVRAGKPKNWR